MHKLRNFILTLVLVFSTASLIVSCSKTETELSPDKVTINEVNQELKELVNGMKEYSYEEKDQATEQVKATINDINLRISKLNADVNQNTAEISESTKQQAEATIKVLERKRDKLSERYAKLEIASAEAWEELKAGFIDSYKALEKGLS